MTSLTKRFEVNTYTSSRDICILLNLLKTFKQFCLLLYEYTRGTAKNLIFSENSWLTLGCVISKSGLEGANIYSGELCHPVMSINTVRTL